MLVPDVIFYDYRPSGEIGILKHPNYSPIQGDNLRRQDSQCSLELDNDLTLKISMLR